MQTDKFNDDTFSLLLLLQHGDSQFPSGSFAFSAGLEALYADKRIASVEELAQFVEGQLRHRWASLDRVALVRTHRLAKDLDGIAALDRELEAMSLAQGLRDGSSRNGNALLSMHVRLQTPLAADYRALISTGKARGHIPIVQGLLWGQLGLNENQAEAAGAHGVSSALLGAAMRLGKVGHIDVQKIRGRMNLVVMKLLADPVESEAVMHAYVAAAEIAAMRHETSELRLFAN
jgi:urease accessory protein